MSDIRFRIPPFPHLRRFSDPYIDFALDEENLAAIAAKPPGSLSYLELLHIFNWLPAGTFEEMAPYIPHALNFILRKEDDDDGEAGQLLEQLISWCYKEQKELESRPDFLRGMQEAFMSLFELWASQTAWRENEQAEGGVELRYDYRLRTLIFRGDECSKIRQKVDRDFGHEPRPAIPWLSAEHYLARLTALDSLPHAAWTLLFCKVHTRGKEQKHAIPDETMMRALHMVDDWLLSGTASEADMLLWDPVTTRHWEELHSFSNAQ